MSTATTESHRAASVADLLHGLGDIDPARIRMIPPPGTAAEGDLAPGVELVDGTLVEKAKGFREAHLAAALIFFLEIYLTTRRIGFANGADATIRLAPGLVRIPDVAYFPFARLPGGAFPDAPIPNLAPALAVEVLSAANTEAEMRRKRAESFAAGVEVVWLVDPAARSVRAYRSETDVEIIDGELSVEDLLPEFRLGVSEWFERAFSV